MSSPNLDQLRKSARDLLAAMRTNDPLARKRVAAHIPRFAHSATDLRLAEAQFVVARESGYPSWPKLKVAIESGAASGPTGLSGPPCAWRKALVHHAAQQAAQCAEKRDVEGLLRALSLLGRRAGDTVRGLLVGGGAYPAVVETLIAGLESHQPRLRFECVSIMDHFADERCIEPLRRLLTDPVPRIRRMALHSLSCDACKIAPLPQQTDFIGLAIEQALNDPSIQVRRHAVAELASRCHDPRAVAALERLRAEDADERIHGICSRMKTHL